MSYQSASVIEVRVWGRLVGAAALNPDTGWYALQFHPDWIAGGVELAPLHMPLRAEPYEFPELSELTFRRLPALLADALPDAFGNALVDAWMAEHGVAPDQVTALDRLAYAADRAIGALEFRPPARTDDEPEPTGVALADLVTAARNVINGNVTGDEAAYAALSQLIQVGTSAPGARAKAVVAYQPHTGQIRSPYAAPVAGFEHWLIKLDGVSATGMDGHGDGLGASAPYGRIEYAYHCMARDAGITMADCNLLAEGPRRHFMTRRFDRDLHTGERHHVLSLCAMAHLDFNLTGAHSYDQYLQTVDRLGLGPDALAEAYRRMAFNVAAVNRDDHTKNVGFLLREGGTWELAPAYDITHAYASDSRWTSTHQMTVDGHVDGITIEHLHRVGERNDVPGYRQLTRDVLDAVSRWPEHAASAELDADTTTTIAADMDRFAPR